MKTPEEIRHFLAGCVQGGLSADETLQALRGAKGVKWNLPKLWHVLHHEMDDPFFAMMMKVNSAAARVRAKKEPPAPSRGQEARQEKRI